jgi:adenylate cyclase
MADDEEATVRTITSYRESTTDLIQSHNGRVADAKGDNILAEFASVVDGVRCAVEIQRGLKQRNSELPDHRKMEFRIGINLGDIIEEEETIYGDGVNIASRLEGLSHPGGICISGTAYDHVKNKLDLGYEYLGEQTVKNIPEPVRVYRVLMEPEAVGKVIGEKRARLKGRQWAIVAAVVLIFGAAAVTTWNFSLRSATPDKKAASMVKTAISLAERASIAVLPFKNLSDDPKQEYFSDGITNDIITDLSKFRELLVIASNTVFTYKGKPVKVIDVARDLGVRYILEGSVQKASEKVRVNAQLIDATTGSHLWAERYEPDLKDLFAMQDELVQTIVATLAVKVGSAERERAMRKDTDSLEAYDYLLRGMEYLSRATRSANSKARQLFRRAIELDPRYASAYVALGMGHEQAIGLGWTEFPAQLLKRVHDLAKKALSLEESNAGAHALLGTVYTWEGQHDLAINELKRAIELNPNDASSHYTLGWVMLYSGRVDGAIHSIETALRFDPNISQYDLMRLGLSYYLKGRYDDSISTLKRGLAQAPDFVFIHIALAAAYAQSGRTEDAAREAQTVLRLHPFFEVDSYGTVFHNSADRAAIIEGLRKAGLK